MPVQYGGGLRSLPAVRDALRAGAERVILGTAAYTDVDFLDDVLGAFRERVIVSVDTRGGNISTSGLAADDADAGRVGHRAPAEPRRALVHLHERRQGRDARAAPIPRRCAASRASSAGAFCTRAASGRSTHLRALRDLRQVNLGGVIVGKALYEGRFTVPEGQEALEPARG